MSSKADSFGPYGWRFEDGKFLGLSVGTKVVCTKSQYIGHVGSVLSLNTDGTVTYIFPTFSSSTGTHTASVSKTTWGIAVIPSDSSMTRRMTRNEAKKYYQPNKREELCSIIPSRADSNCLGPYGWLFKDGKFQGLSIGTKVVCTKSAYIGHVGHVVSLQSNGKVTYLFPTFSVCRETYTAKESKSRWGIAVIPSDSSMTRRMSEGEASKFYMPEREVISKIELETEIENNQRKEVLLSYLQHLAYLVDIILDYEDAIQLWFSPLGWVFENGKYLGLQKDTKVVCTKSSYIGYVGWVDNIEENDPQGNITYYFPKFAGGSYPEMYTAANAIRSWGLCVVPDDTDLDKIMSPEVALSYLTARESEHE